MSKRSADAFLAKSVVIFATAISGGATWGNALLSRSFCDLRCNAFLTDKFGTWSTVDIPCVSKEVHWETKWILRTVVVLCRRDFLHLSSSYFSRLRETRILYWCDQDIPYFDEIQTRWNWLWDRISQHWFEKPNLCGVWRVCSNNSRICNMLFVKLDNHVLLITSKSISPKI